MILTTSIHGGIKAEAVHRMRELKLYEPIIREYEEEDILNFSEQTFLGGILYWLRDSSAFVQKVNEYEKKYRCSVYHVVHSYTSIGELLIMLTVSMETEDWEYERKNIEMGYVPAYVYNLSFPEFSEHGIVPLHESAGGLVYGKKEI